MQNFIDREDRFHFFNTFENPLLNLTFNLRVGNFLPYCKQRNLPPFHFFLYQVFQALMKIENFKYRVFQNEIIRIDEYIASYTVLNFENNLNFTRFKYSSDLNEFIKRSLVARDEASKSKILIHTGHELNEREIRNYVFITSLPWFEFTGIQHPVFKYKGNDIPSIAWGKFQIDDEFISMPFSVQAHHGFVDGFHVHQLSEEIIKNISKTLEE